MTSIIDGKDVAIDCIISDTPGGYLVVVINGEKTVVRLDNKQVKPIMDQIEDQ